MSLVSLVLSHLGCMMSTGFYGGDCSLSMNEEGKPQLLAGLGYQVRRRKPSIYVYELPPSFNTYFNLKLQDRPVWFMIYQVRCGRPCAKWRKKDADSF